MSLPSTTLPAHDTAIPSTMPPEIEERVIDELRYNVNTLRQCSLTCSRWLPRSRHHLFAVVRVQTREQLFSLCAAITQYTHLRPLVHSVTLQPEAYRPKSEHLTETIPVPLLTLLPNLTRWSVIGQPLCKAKEMDTEDHGPQEYTDRDREVCYPAPPCHRMALACLRRNSTTIQNLHLSKLSFPTSMDCAKLLLSFPALSSLRCDGILVQMSQVLPDTWMDRVAGHVHIRSLSVSA